MTDKQLKAEITKHINDFTGNQERHTPILVDRLFMLFKGEFKVRKQQKSVHQLWKEGNLNRESLIENGIIVKKSSDVNSQK